MIKVSVPATTANIGPGFDCIGLALNCSNTLEVTQLRAGPGPKIVITGEGAKHLSTGKDNLVYRAMISLFHEVGFKVPPLGIHLENKVPLARGLGSSACAVVAGLLAANRLCGEPLSPMEVLDLAANLEGHPDNVAPALLGGLVISAPKTDGRGYHYLRLEPPKEVRAIVCVPEFTVDTDTARRVLPDKVSFRDAVFNVGRTALFLGSLFAERWDMLPFALQDRLHQEQRKSLVPGMDSVIFQAKRAGALGAALSGAGPSIIALSLNKEDEIGKAMQTAFSDFGIRSRILFLGINLDGSQVT